VPGCGETGTCRLRPVDVAGTLITFFFTSTKAKILTQKLVEQALFLFFKSLALLVQEYKY
jgi:hypothetical protein